MTRTTAQDALANEREQLISDLRRRIPIGTTIYTVLRGTPSASGGYRRMSAFYILPGSDRLVNLDHAIIQLGIGQQPVRGGDGFGVRGGGMDMGYHVVYSLGRKLWPDGFSVKLSPATKSDAAVVQTERDGGYAFSHRWL